MKRILEFWHRVDVKIQKAEELFIVFALMAILITGVLSIILRNTVGWGIATADTLARQLTVWMGLLGASLATTTAEHINIDAFSRLFKGKRLWLNRLFITLFCIFGSIVLSYVAFSFVAFYYKDPVFIEIGSVKISNWYLLLIFPFAFLLITLRYIVQAIEFFYAFRGEILPHSLAEKLHLDALEQTEHHEENNSPHPSEDLLIEEPSFLTQEEEIPSETSLDVDEKEQPTISAEESPETPEEEEGRRS